MSSGKLKFLRKSCGIVGIVFVLLLIVMVGFVTLWVPDPNNKYHSVVVFVSTPSSSAPQDVAYAEQMRIFLETNGGCELPCFLGIRAGETSLESASEKYRTMLDTTFQYIAEPRIPLTPTPLDPYYRLYLVDHVHGLHVNISLPVEPKYDSGDGMITSFSIGAHTWQRDADSYYAQVMERYLLPAILRDMGIPDQVWIRPEPVNSDPYTGMPYYTLWLYYFEQRMWIEYQGDLEKRGDQLLLCPSKSVTFSIDQWWPKERMTAETVLADPPRSFSVLLEQATGVNITAFYEMFKDPGSQACLETPTQMWEYPEILTHGTPPIVTQTTPTP